MNVLQLLEFQEVDMPDMVSVSINGDVLNRDTFETTLIKEGDAVEFVYFMGGGCAGRAIASYMPCLYELGHEAPT